MNSEEIAGMEAQLLELLKSKADKVLSQLSDTDSDSTSFGLAKISDKNSRPSIFPGRYSHYYEETPHCKSCEDVFEILSNFIKMIPHAKTILILRNPNIKRVWSSGGAFDWKFESSPGYRGYVRFAIEL